MTDTQATDTQATDALAAVNTIVESAAEAVQIVSEVKPITLLKPFMKWVGGKTQIIHDVLSLFPANMHHYHEPFLGGGSVLLALLSYRQQGILHVSGRIYASDVNSNLIGLYIHLQSNPAGLIEEVKALTDAFATCTGDTVHRKATTLEEAMSSPESYYFWIRSRFNALSKEERTSLRASAMLLFMNKTCFRGVYREGPHGFNVPFGNYKNPIILEEDHIYAVSRLIQDVIFTACPFQEALARAETGDFVYLDPPYAPEQETSFVAYTSDGFTQEHHTALFERCKALTAKKIGMVMSNADVALVKDAFPSPSYTTRILSCRRAIHSKTPAARTNEVLITNVEN